MNPSRPERRLQNLALAAAALVLSACAGVPAARSVVLEPTHDNVVSYWNEVANQAVNAPPLAGGTPEEQRPSYHAELATVHVAVYDAVTAIDGRYKPFAVTPKAAADGASMDAAASAAAYGVLRALFPSRAAALQAAYERRLAAIPEGPARARGLALGEEVAQGVVRWRADDGRAVQLQPYVSGSLPGQFRAASPTPLNRFVPFMRPFALTHAAQFRPAGPPPLNSAAYARALEEARRMGGSVSSERTPEQLEIARFHTEPPGPYLTRNLGRLAASTADVADAARLMALLYVAHADAITACFEAKYHHGSWRPLSAVPAVEPAWTPVLPTPNHPEYPAAHSCTAGALGEALRQFFGTTQVAYHFDSRATGTTRRYADTDALSRESQLARVAGGMHFSFSAVDGVELGTQVARWVAEHHFQRQR